VWGFLSTIIDGGAYKDDRLVIVSWPSEVERVRVRRHERVTVAVPCVIELPDGSQADAKIVDLSAGGCATDSRAVVEEGIRVSISFLLTSSGFRADRLSAVVRSSRRDRRGEYRYGLQFINVDDATRGGIDMFVTRELVRQRSGGSTRSCVVVVSGNPLDLQSAQVAFAGQDWEVVGATGVLDLGFVVGTHQVRAVLIAAEQGGMGAFDICRVLRQSPSTAELPVVIYGGEEDAVQKHASAERAVRWIRDMGAANTLVPLISAAGSAS
jgi:CheY-like chemotaxis protein